MTHEQLPLFTMAGKRRGEPSSLVAHWRVCPHCGQRTLGNYEPGAVFVFGEHVRPTLGKSVVRCAGSGMRVERG